MRLRENSEVHRTEERYLAEEKILKEHHICYDFRDYVYQVNREINSKEDLAALCGL